MKDEKNIQKNCLKLMKILEDEKNNPQRVLIVYPIALYIKYLIKELCATKRKKNIM